MQLLPMKAEDENLAVQLECDPKMMLHIGGPRPEADVRTAHKRRLELMDKGEAQMYKIVADNSNKILGTIGIWKIDREEPKSYEMGWFVFPEHQRKGIATEAAQQIIAQVRSDPKVHFVHAFPAVSNVASNVIAHRIGMQNLGRFDNESFAGVLHCNNWCIDVS